MDREEVVKHLKDVYHEKQTDLGCADLSNQQRIEQQIAALTEAIRLLEDK